MRVLLICSLILQSVPQGYAQTSLSSATTYQVEVVLPTDVPSESVLIRYCITGSSHNACNWIAPQIGVHSYFIEVVKQTQLPRTWKAIAYAPGCALQTFSVSVAQNGKYPFVCRPVSSVAVNGVITQTERLRGRQVELQAKYVAYWAKEFFGVDDGVITAFPIGPIGEPTSGNQFHLDIPDFSAFSQPSAIQIWAKEKGSGELIALLMPNEYALQRRENGIRSLITKSGYPTEISFVPCMASHTHQADHLKFAIRPDATEVCQ